MESPVRICFSAAIVMLLLLLSNSRVLSSAIPPSTPSESTKPAVQRSMTLGYAQVNRTTWIPRKSPIRSSTDDPFAANDVNPKKKSQDEQAKDSRSRVRGAVRYNIQNKEKKTSTGSRLRATSTTKKPEVEIITPTPETKNISQTIDSMKKFKTSMTPRLQSTSTQPMTERESGESTDTEQYDNDENDNYDISKFTSSEFHDEDNVYTLPGYSAEELYPQRSNKKRKHPSKHVSNTPYESYSSSKPKDYFDSYKSKPYEEFSSYEPFDHKDLTTPQNELFDKRFREITQSIIESLAKHKSENIKQNDTHRANIHGVNVTKSLDVEEFMNRKPENNSKVFFHKSKSILVSDNEAEGSSLSDVQGTSIYFETSMLSTESYGSDFMNEADCDNDTITEEPTPSTPQYREDIRILSKSTVPTSSSTQASVTKRYKEGARLQPKLTASTSYSTHVSVTPQYIEDIRLQSNSTEPTSFSTHASVTTNYPNRNVRISPKKINFSPQDHKDIEKDETFTRKSEELSSNHLRPVTRRIQFTSPKPRVTYRISVKRNPNAQYTKSTYPTTIYAEHFNSKDKTPSETPDKKQTILTTVSSDIDPILETEISGTKKVVHTHTISDNTIPSLRKRGSTKFVGSSTAEPASSEDASSSYMAIPPTSSAWGALAGMRNPPSLTSPTANATSPNIKIFDENELQKVAESTEKLHTPSTTTTSTISNNINVDLYADKVETFDQEWKPFLGSSNPSTSTVLPTSTSTGKNNIIEMKSIPPSPTEVPHTTAIITNELIDSKADASIVDSETSVDTDWIPVSHTELPSLQNISSIEHHSNSNVYSSPKSTTVTSQQLNTELPSLQTLSSTEISRYLNNISSDSPLMSTFESITKLPSNLTTPQIDDDLATTTNLPTQYKIKNKTNSYLSTTAETTVEDTTFTFIPISTVSDLADTTTVDIHEESTTHSPIETPETWHPVLPTRKISPSYKSDDHLPITTYRPTFFTTLESETETEIPTESPIYTIPNAVSTTTMKVDVTTSDLKPELTTTFETQPEITTTVLVETTTVQDIIMPVVETTTEEVITQKSEPTKVFIPLEGTIVTTDLSNETVMQTSSETSKFLDAKETTTVNAEQAEITTTVSSNEDFTVIVTTDITTEEETTIRTVSKLEDLTSNFSDDLTTPSPYDGKDMVQPSSAAGVAIAVSTIGVIALLLLIGLLLVLRRRRRRGRRCGVYAQRCTPVSLDAYSLDSVSVSRRKGDRRLRASKRSYGNPAYDDEVVISHPMQYAALANFALDSESMAAEFAEIPAGTVRADEVPAGCEDKNRFSNVLPLPETRVQLQRLDNDPTTEYINANYVTGPGNIKNYYIACQAPMSNTVNDFWRMIWEQNSRVIVMLTEYMENGVEKCYEYLPPSEVTDNKRTFDNFQVILKRREHRDKYAVSSVQLKNLTTKTWREVSHLWYFWPARGVPDDYDSVINFMSEMRSHMKISQNAKEFEEDGSDAAVVENGSSNNLSKLKTDDSTSLSGKGVHVYSPAKAEEMMRKTNGTNGTLGRMKAAAELEGVRPCVVTCASGAGRSGALVALDICARALEGSMAVDVPRTVRALRSARPHALQNKMQYMFLYKVLSEYGNKLTGGVDSI